MYKNFLNNQYFPFTFFVNFFFFILFLLKITAHFHLAIHRTAFVVALPGSVFSGKHRLGASLIFRKLEVVVDANIMSTVLYIKIIGADEGKGPVQLLPFFIIASFLIIAFSPLLDCFFIP